MKVHFVISTLIAVAVLGKWLAAEESRQAIRLREAAEVNHATILLSDLLPPNVSNQMQKIGATIELGKAPQAGILRVLYRDQILEGMRSNPELLNMMIVPPTVMVHFSGWPISKTRVRNAISEFLRKNGDGGFSENATIVLPGFLAASEPNYHLEVTKLRTDFFKPEIQAEVRCISPRSCGSFLVRVTSFQSEGFPQKLTRAISPRGAVGKSSDGSGPRLVAQGKPATLMLEDSTTRISLPVVCLGSGGLNERIRVMDKQSRRIYAAEVIGDQLLRASL